MKTIPITTLIVSVLALGTLESPQSLGSTQPSIPVGSLTATPTVVQSGTKPNLTWSINYPSVVKNYINIPTGGGTITPLQNLICDIRVLGLGVTTQNSNGSVNFIETRALLRYNGSSSWITMYDGKETDTLVQQQGIIKTYTVTANKAMDFGGQYYWNNSWQAVSNSPGGAQSFVSSISNPTQVWSLVNGDLCPNKVPAYGAPSLESFLKNYLDSSNHVVIGPMDVIIFMELTDTTTTAVGYDQQDCVLLVTFRTS